MGLDNSAVTSLLSLLDESDAQLKAHALRALLDVVDSHWAIVSEALTKIENLAEDDRFPARQTAAALASKCFFHLEEYDDATRLALNAGEYFDVEGSSAYSKAIVGRCLETYVNLRGGQERSPEEKNDELDPKLEKVVERMFSNCYSTKNFKRAIGMALEAKRLDKLREAIKLSSPNERAMMTYSLQNMSTQQSKFRQEVIATLIELYSEAREDDVDHLEWFECLHALQRVDDYASLLIKLVTSPNSQHALVAFQAAFDLVEFQDQRFEKALDESLQNSPLLPSAMSTEQTKALETLRSILFEGKKAALLLDFMYKKNGTDLLLIKKFKDAAEAGRKNSVLHHAMIVAHGYAQCGTTADTFLRENLDWLGRASNWAKFGATASLGVVHKGNVESAMMLLRPYLPSPDQGHRSSPFSEGGALYALGLIHSAEGVSPAAKKRALEHLTTNLEAASVQELETVRDSHLHGSCLGIGLVSMSSSDEGLLERLKNTVYADSAVVGEAASLGMGLIMLGGGGKHASMIEELRGYARDTKHEKIVRGISLCAALTFYGQEDQADVLIEQLCSDKDHLIRYGGVFTIGAAYVGTANNAAVRRLLHIAVSDVSNDVRRAAVICLGLVMVRLPERLPGLIALLSESYNPHVRYGAAIALGVGCSTQADPKEALELLEPLLDDKIDFVRQGAMIGTAFLLAQVRPEVDARAKRFREKIFTVVSDTKQASTMTRMGALLASGIVDAGGRNAFLSIIGRNGLPKPPAVAGFILWVQYWFWYPLMHMLSLSLSPSALIGVNADLDLPKAFQVDCLGGEVGKRFGMPDPTEEKKEEVKSRVKTAVLSTTAKVSLRQKLKAAATGSETGTDGATPTNGGSGDAAATAAAGGNGGESKKKTLPDDKELLTNPVRVTKAMAGSVRFKPSERYLPACGDDQHVGVIVLRDSTPNEAQEVVKVAVPPAGDVDPNEPGPPEPFEWTPPAEE